MTAFGDVNYRDVPGRGDMPGRVPGDPQHAEDGPETVGCDRPGCDGRARHQFHVRGETVEGWEYLCCEHAEALMRVASLAVPPAEGVVGSQSWRDQHAQMCGDLHVFGESAT